MFPHWDYRVECWGSERAPMQEEAFKILAKSSWSQGLEPEGPEHITQRAQYPLIKEYTLNGTRVPKNCSCIPQFRGIGLHG